MGTRNNEIRESHEKARIAAAQEGAQAPAARGAHLYVMRHDGGDIKIGRSNNPAMRRRSLETGSGRNVQLLLVLPDRGHEEGDLHDRLYDHRLIGEWFQDGLEFRAELVAALGVEIDFRKPKKLKKRKPFAPQSAETIEAMRQGVENLRKEMQIRSLSPLQKLAIYQVESDKRRAALLAKYAPLPATPK